MNRRSFFIYNIEGGNYVESLLIAAVTTILSIRFYLDLTGYPKIGGGGLHIAHMLWGGFLMLFAIFILLLFLNRSFLHSAAIIAGIGFGAFIDELGKFVTSDNNYFFEPTFAIIYIIFIILFILLRFLEKRHKFSQEENIENAFELTRGVLFRKEDQYIREKALNILGKVDPSVPVAKYLRLILEVTPAQAQSTRKTFSIIRPIHLLYERLMRNRWFLKGMVIFFIVFSLYNLFKAMDVVRLYFRLNELNLTYIEWGKFLSSIASSAIVICGLIAFKFSSIRGYKIFKLGVLFSLFITQFFDFYDNQLGAAGVFLINILVLITLNNIIRQQFQAETITEKI